MNLSLALPPHARVLVRDPGPRVVETVHTLTGQGATVTVWTSTPQPDLVDLEDRGLVLLAADPDLAHYDVVLRDPARATTPHVVRRGNGRVVLVGGGPGDPGLLTVAGLEAVRTADVLVCDRLAPLAVLDQARPDAEVVHVGKIPRGGFTPQEEINDLLVRHAQAGRTVVRLKGGDGFVFGRGGEEWNACVAGGVAVEVVPGVSSSVAVPGLAHIPLTHRGLSQGFVVVSGHVTPDDPRCEVDWAALARCGLTLVVLMGVATLDDIAATLVARGLPAETPVACVANGATPQQRTVTGQLSTIAEVAERGGIVPPAITVIGAVVTALDQPSARSEQETA